MEATRSTGVAPRRLIRPGASMNKEGGRYAPDMTYSQAFAGRPSGLGDNFPDRSLRLKNRADLHGLCH